MSVADVIAAQSEPVSQLEPALRIWTPEEIWEPLPPPSFAIGGLLMKGDTMMVCAYGSSLKSWMEIDLLIAKASGGKWLGIFQCEPSPVLLIDWESGSWEARRRFQAVARARGIVGAVPGVHMISLPDMYFPSPTFEPTIRELAATFKVICFDTLSAGSPDMDENDARFAKGLNVAKRVCSPLECSPVVLHHSRKMAPGAGDRDERESPRGTGAIFGAVDVMLQMSKRKDGSFLVKQTKARSGPCSEPFIVRIDDMNGGVSVSGSPVEEDDDEGAQDSGFVLAKRRVLALLAKEKDLKSKNQIQRHAKGAKKAVFDAVDDLMEDGLVKVWHGAFRLSSEVGE